jgi:hypothetical protein
MANQNPWRLPSLIFTTLALGLPVVLILSQVLVMREGASLDPGNTVMWHEPALDLCGVRV